MVPGYHTEQRFLGESVPQDFLDQFYECTTMFHSIQTEVNGTNMRLYKRGTTPGDDKETEKYDCKSLHGGI
jgi:hypothetical protein